MSIRKAFLEELKSLRRNTGLLQYENLKAQKNGHDEINALLDALEKVRRGFAVLPDEKVVNLMKKGIMSTPELRGLYPNVLWGWLDQYLKQLPSAEYFKLMEGEKEPENEATILSIEEAAPYLKQLKENLSEVGISMRDVTPIKESPPAQSVAQGYKFEIVTCSKCNGEKLTKEGDICGHCNGIGQIKQIKK
jgi:hypothetical protein